MKQNKFIIDQIKTYQSVGNDIQLSENIVEFGRKVENGVNTYYRAYYMMDKPFKNTNQMIIKAILKVKIITYPTALMYSVHTVKSKITSNQLPIISTTPILDNLYPDNQFQSFDITKAIMDPDFCGIMIKATTETGNIPGYAQLGGSSYLEQPILEIDYYEKECLIKKENSKNYFLNDKGILSINLIQFAKHFYHCDLTIGPIDFQHLYFDEYIQWGKDKENNQITPNYHMGIGIKNNLQRFLSVPHRKHKNVEDKEIYSVEINNQLVAFKKKYIYDDGNIHFVDETKVKKSAIGELTYTLNNQTYDVQVVYYDEHGRAIQLNESYYELINQLGKQRSLKKFYMDSHNKKCLIDENKDETFDMEIAYLEGYEGYYVDKEFIEENESGDMVYNQNGIYLEVMGYGKKKRRINKKGYEESYLTSFLQYNQKGQIEAGFSKRIIQREQGNYEELSAQLFEEKTLALDYNLQTLFNRKEELIMRYKDFQMNQENRPIAELQNKYNELQTKNAKIQANYSEYQLQKEQIILEEKKAKVDKKIENLRRRLQSEMGEISEEEIQQYIEKNSELWKEKQDIETQINLNINNQSILDNQEEMRYLQILIQEKNEELKKTQIKIQLTQIQNNIDQVTQQIQELQERLQEYIKIEKAKPIDFMIENNNLMGFDFEGKMVQRTQGNQSIKMVYEEEYLTQVRNQNDEILFELNYQEGLLHHIKDYYGRIINYTYESNFLKEVTFLDETFVQYSYNDFGLSTIQDAYGNKIEVVSSFEHQEIKKYSNIQSISYENVENKTYELLEEDTIYFGREQAIVTNKNGSFVYLFDDLGNINSSYQKDNQNNIQNAINHFENEKYAYTFHLEETTKNALKNGSFESGNTNWTIYGDSSFITNPTISGSKSLQLNESEGIRKIQQSLSSLELNANQIHAFMFSGWAKANHSLYVNKNQRKLEEEKELNIQSNAKFELRAEILYEGGSKEIFSSTFDWSNKDWQLCSLPVLIDENKNVQSITFIADYSFNAGEVIFDNFRVSKAKGELTQYNENRTIQYTTDFKKKINYLQYEKGKPILIEEIDENGYHKTITYSYGPNQELRKIETSEGIISEFFIDEENKITTTMVYHKEDPTTRYDYYQHFDEQGRVIYEKEKDNEEKNTVTYTYYDEICSLLKTQKIGNQTIYYGYHPNNDQCISQSQSINHIDYSLIYGYTNNLLTQVKNNDGTTINYEYDNHTNLTKVKINDKDMVQISTTEGDVTYYQDGTCITEKGTIQVIHSLNENDSSVKKIYNKDGQLIQLGYIQQGNFYPTLSCEYNKKGQLTLSKDEKNLKETFYFYNEDGLLSSIQNDKLKTTFTYHPNHLVSQKVNSFDNTHTYTYLSDYEHPHNPSLCTQYAYQDFVFNYDYDLLQRIKQKKTLFNNVVLLQEKYGYLKEGNQTFNRVNRVQISLLNKTKDDYQYEYDPNGNILKIYENGRLINHYRYDEANRLIEEKDQFFNQKSTYLYDSNGNILNKITYNLKTGELIQENNYQYASNGLSDILVSYNNDICHYDDYGNITSYRNQICKYNPFHKIIQIGENHFIYDAYGCRTRKNKIYYEYDGEGNLYKEDGEHEIFYHYEGNKVHRICVDGNDYLLRRNLLNDVTHIYNTNGELCAMYRYDAWGNHKVYDENGNENKDTNFIGNINPIRYRGYYFDVETGLFYCNSRYYSPELCRWISPDSIEYLDPNSINGLNLYCYCYNDPINYADSSGHFAISTFLIGLAVTSLLSWGLSEIFGAQIVGGVGSIANGMSAISTGISLFAFGPVGWIIGGIGIIAGLTSIAFGTAEIQEGLGYGNWINEIGITGDLYTGLYIGSNIVSSLTTIGGNIYRNSRITSGVSQADKTGRAYSRYYQMEGNKVRSITHYGKGGTPKYRIDILGHPHNGLLPHKHNFVINNGFVNKGSVDDINYLLWLLLGNWR